MYKQRVLIVHNYYQIPGGEDTVVANEKKMLEDNGHQVFMYTRHNDEIKERNIFGKIKLPFETIYSLKTKKEVKKIIKENKIDIVHVHNTLPLISSSVYWAAKECGIKVVQTIHNFRLLCPAATFVCKGHICENCLKHGLKCAVKNKCYRDSRIQTLIVVLMLKINKIIGSYNKVDSYIALTDFNKEKLSSLISKEKIFVKPNFVNNNRGILPYNIRKNQFVFIGRLDKLKGIDLLIKTWNNIRDFDLIICGTGPEEEWCRKFIEENRLTNVKLMGFVQNFKAVDIIAESRALILPTQWYEGFPMTIVESFSCGTPVIGSDIGNVSNLIQDGVTGLKFRFNSVNSLREKVYNLSDMVESCTNEFDRMYSFNNNYKQLLKIYSSGNEVH